MNGGESYSLLWLSGQMQSYGCESHFSQRGTLAFPTKSAVYGMILAGMGKTGKQDALLSEMALWNMTVRCYSEGQRLLDYCTVGCGYPHDDSWESMFIPRKPDGSYPVAAGGMKGGQKILEKEYLTGAVFAVILSHPMKYGKRISDAFERPVFPQFLGRKCCIASDYIYRGLYSTKKRAESAADKVGISAGMQVKFKVEDNTADYENSRTVMSIRDVPVEFGIHKKYSYRTVSIYC